METIGTRIALFRNARRWTQEHLAIEIGIPQSELSKIETDKISPKWETIEMIADKLDIPTLSLLPLATNNIMNNSFQDQSGGVINHFHANIEKEKVLWEALLKAKEELLETKDKLIQLLEQQRAGNNKE